MPEHGLSVSLHLRRADGGLEWRREYAPPVPTRSPRRIPWTEIFKFLAGAFFVSSGVLGYLYVTRTPVPLLGTDIDIQPGTHAVRAVIHGVLFAVCFYVGFLRRPRNGGA